MRFRWALLFWSCGSLAGCGASLAEAGGATSEGTHESAPVAELESPRVLSALRGNETELRRCFMRAPSARGFAAFEWLVSRTGEVTDLELAESTLGSERVEACLTERVGELRFGELPEPVRARWVFVFRLVDPEQTVERRREASKLQSSESKRRAREEETWADGVQIEPDSEGSLPLERIDGVIQAGYRLYARCFRDGVDRDLALGGDIRLRFVVAETGTVTRVEDAGSDLSDRQVVDCVAEAFFALRFPRPENGSVSVAYRIQFGSG